MLAARLCQETDKELCSMGGRGDRLEDASAACRVARAGGAGEDLRLPPTFLRAGRGYGTRSGPQGPPVVITGFP